jgi:DNA-binding XRE family transcriptional regulator
MSQTCIVCEQPRASHEMSQSKGPRRGWCLYCTAKYSKGGPQPRIPAERRLVPLLAGEISARAEGSLPPYELVKFRARYGLTQTGFAKAIGASVPAISSWENGYTAVPLYVRLAMSAFIAGLPPYNG